MKILVLGQTPEGLHEWARKSLVGREVRCNPGRMRVEVDGVEFMLATYDDAEEGRLSGLTYQTVLHADHIPFRVRSGIRFHSPKLPIYPVRDADGYIIPGQFTGEPSGRVDPSGERRSALVRELPSTFAES